jgi:hypothetical protein
MHGTFSSLVPFFWYKILTQDLDLDFVFDAVITESKLAPNELV